MTGPETIRLAELEPAKRLAAHAQAARAVQAGQIVVGSTELGYAAVCTPVSLPALSSLVNSPGSAAVQPAWLCPDHDHLFAFAPWLSAVQRRVIRRLSPGLLLLRVGLGDPRAPEGLTGLGLPTGVCDDGRWLRVRLGDTQVLSRVAALLDGPCPILVPLMDASGRAIADASSARALLDAKGLVSAHLLDAGEPAGSSPKHGPTIIDLGTAGGVHVQAEGAYQRRFVLSQAGLTILFVCTGNTCRSPMAEAIAAGVLAKSEPGVPVRVLSAGLHASSGEPTTPEAADALADLGYTPPRHGSRPLDRALLQQADMIFTMTRSHLQGILAMDPAARAQMLDPAGQDVPDPIGAGPAVYESTARRLLELIQIRLKELHL